jgi:excisionase family DNA binding protein
MNMAATPSPVEQTPLAIAAQDQDQVEILKLYERMRRSKAKLVGPDGHSVNLPDSLYTFLCRVLADLLEGKSVSIVQSQAQLTTVEAASLLGVSRQFLINVLERGDIPFHKVGAHRRVYVRDLFAYKAKRDGLRRKVLDDLVQSEVDEGLYDSEPPEPADAGSH